MLMARYEPINSITKFSNQSTKIAKECMYQSIQLIKITSMAVSQLSVNLTDVPGLVTAHLETAHPQQHMVLNSRGLRYG